MKQQGVPQQPKWLYIISSLNHLFLLCNSSVNFIIYCFCGSRFRKSLSCQQRTFGSSGRRNNMNNHGKGPFKNHVDSQGGRGVKKFLILSTSTYIKSVYVGEGGSKNPNFPSTWFLNGPLVNPLVRKIDQGIFQNSDYSACRLERTPIRVLFCSL